LLALPGFAWRPEPQNNMAFQDFGSIADIFKGLAYLSFQNRHFLEKSEFLAKKGSHVWLFGLKCQIRFSPQFKTAGR
jgi:hypothetical protein